MFCSNCGAQVADGANFCPNCGAQLNAVAATTVPTVATAATPIPTAAVAGDTVMLVSLGSCAPDNAACLLQQTCGYGADEALLIAQSAPCAVARGLTDAQARYLAQALSEYGMEISVYNQNGWLSFESASTSVWDKAGALIAAAASALGLIGLKNRISRDLMRRWDYPHRFTGNRPPVYRLHGDLTRRTPQPPQPKRPAAPPRPAAKPRPAAQPRPTAQPAHGQPGGQGTQPGGHGNQPGNHGGQPGGGRPGGHGGPRH